MNSLSNKEIRKHLKLRDANIAKVFTIVLKCLGITGKLQVPDFKHLQPETVRAVRKIHTACAVATVAILKEQNARYSPPKKRLTLRQGMELMGDRTVLIDGGKP